MVEFGKVLDDLRTASKAAPDVHGLRSIRDVLVQPDFVFQLEENIGRSHNRPEARVELRSTLLSIKHCFRDQKAQRSEDHTHTATIVTGGGLALGAGGILALLTQAGLYPLFPFLPIAAGLYAIWRGMNAGRTLSAEVSVLEDIIESLDAHIEALGRGGLAR